MTPFIGALLLVACGGLVPSQGAVIELDDNSFYDYAKERDVLLVDFYAPWCSDCKNLEPDFQAAGASLGARSIDLAKVDCFGAGKGLCTKYGIKRWPTLKNFNRGTFTGDYTGGLSAGEIAGYVNTVENSASPQVVSNPYAAPYTPMVMQTQQCVTRCKISKITNKAPCFAKCKAPKAPARKMLPQPVINEKSCAKCRQPQIAGKFSTYCSAIEDGCRRLNEVESSPIIPKDPTMFQPLVNTSATSVRGEIGSSGLPKQTEHIINGYISRPNLVKDFMQQKSIGSVPRLTKQAPYEDSASEYEKVAGENTFMQKASISHGKHVNGFVDSMTPREALRIPYDHGDKKAKVAKSAYKGRLAFNNVHVDGVSIYSAIA